MRARGYALTELLVAVAIAGLIVGVLSFLNVDYVSLARRASDLQSPYDLGRKAVANATEDLCANPGAVLRPGNDRVIAQGLHISDNALVLDTSADAVTTLSGPNGVAGASRQPVRVVVESAPGRGASTASIEVGAATVGVVAPRCDLPEVCDFDAANSLCKADEANSIVQPS